MVYKQGVSHQKKLTLQVNTLHVGSLRFEQQIKTYYKVIYTWYA